MEVYVQSVQPCAMYQGKIYDFKVHVRTSSGQSITLFDYTEPFDLRSKEGQTVDCLILAGFLTRATSNDAEFQLSGVVVDVGIPVDWLCVRSFITEKSWYGISGADGVCLITDSDKEELQLEVGDSTVLQVGRFDLVGIK
jgi:hypothetical protein